LLRILGAALVSSLLLGTPGPAFAVEDPAGFELATEHGEGFAPVALAASRASVFAAGRVSEPSEPDDAALVAFASRNRRERWQFRWRHPERATRFQDVAVDGGLVCAAGTAGASSADRSLFVACVRARTGALLWRKEVSLADRVGASFAVSLKLVGRTLVVHVPVFFLRPSPDDETTVLVFDARSGGAPEPAEGPEDPAQFLLMPGMENATFRAADVEAGRHQVFVAGALVAAPFAPSKAAVIAFDARNRSERWRFEWPEEGSSLRVVAADAARVCGAGVVPRGTGLGVDSNLLVACFHAHTGWLLWQREIAGLRLSAAMRVELSQGTLVVFVSPSVVVPGRFLPGHVLGFDAHDGSGAGPRRLPGPPGRGPWGGGRGD